MFNRSEIARALKAWSDVADLSFTEVSSGEDIKIKFVTGSHGDNGPFDGEGTLHFQLLMVKNEAAFTRN